MKIRMRPLIFTVLLLIVTMSFFLPVIIWHAKGDSSGVAVILGTREQGAEERESPVAWPFFNSRLEDVLLIEDPEAFPAGGTADSFLYVTDISTLIKSDDDAVYYSDLVKHAAIHSGAAFFDGSSISENHHGLYRRTIEDFLRIENTGWSFIYVRDYEVLDEIPSSIKEKIGSSAEDADPFILFVHENGEVLLLESGADFSGKPPSAELFGRSSELYQWTPIYRAADEAESYGFVDLDLTAHGLEKYSALGLPHNIPLTVHCSGGIASTWFFIRNIADSAVTPGSYRRSFKEWYSSNISLFRPDSADKMYWKIYLPLLSRALSQNSGLRTGEAPVDFRFKAEGSSFLIGKNRLPYQSFFIKGVNLGTALPGRWFTQFPADEHLYLEWFSSMKAMNLNTIRIYTLLPPAFYRALNHFNSLAEEDPLFLIQEIWPQEHPLNNNLLGSDYNADFISEIRMNIDAVHGRGRIASRIGRAWGVYRADVSQWLLAYVIGRELEPDEVTETDGMNEGLTYSGRFISAETGSPTEAWLASACDFAAVYELENYGRARPVGIVSWPTLDPVHHPGEWTDPNMDGKKPFNDRAEVDINHFTVSEYFSPGFFGAYHIYPNYPDFMNNQESYAAYEDDKGVLRYGGYLKEFMAGHSLYPAIVAEYGISTSAATAHLNPDGYHHGGLSELQQAEGIIRMTEAIRREGYAGAVIFEWMDEWAKKTWTTEPFMIPYDRQALWHNALDPEQNYGLTAMEADSVRGELRYEITENGMKLTVWGNESHLYLEISDIPEEYRSGTGVMIGFDTYSRDKGVSNFPDIAVPPAAGGLEFLLKLELDDKTWPERSVLYSADSYNIGLNNFASAEGKAGGFSPIRILVNRGYTDDAGNFIPPGYAETGLLSHGTLDEQLNSIFIDQDSLTIRIPWGLLNISDPSSGRVIDDPDFAAAPVVQDSLATAVSDSIVINGLFYRKSDGSTVIFPEKDGRFTDEIKYVWEYWDVPGYRSRPKKSVSILSDYFKNQ